MDQTLMAETHLSSLQAELDNVKGNPSDEVRDKIIDNFIQSVEFQQSINEIQSPSVECWF